MSSIHVQIASYRDYELLPTLRDLFFKSSGKHSINVGVIWQKAEDESVGEFANDSRVKLATYDWNESRGLGWARSIVQKLYNGEDYVLQLDSHHRFGKDWDEILVNMIKSLETQSAKPLLTAYAAGYDPKNDKALTPVPCKLLPRDFKQSGTIWQNPTPINNWQQLDRPLRGLFVSGHYYFTLGSFVTDFPYDPDMYFAGDEITLTVRGYTAGYDIYHPHRCVVYHHYGRLDRSKHWGDHNDKEKSSGKIKQTWGELDTYSKKRIRQLLGQENNNIDLGVFGLGSERSLDDFIRYSGMDTKRKIIHKDAIAGVEPPMVYKNEEDWEKGFLKPFNVNIKQWPRYQYIVGEEKYTHVDVEFMSLKRTINHVHKMTLDEVKGAKNNIYTRSFETTNLPHKIIFKGMNGDKVVDNWESDLFPGIHWF